MMFEYIFYDSKDNSTVFISCGKVYEIYWNDMFIKSFKNLRGE